MLSLLEANEYKLINFHILKQILYDFYLLFFIISMMKA